MFNIHKKKTFLSPQGFTLIELVMVVAIIGILAAIIMPKLTNQSERASYNSSKANLESLRTAVSVYIADNAGAKPATLGVLVGTYIRAIPAESLTTPPDPTQTPGGVAACGDIGGWLYDAATGDVRINRTTCPFPFCVAENPCANW